jgi:5-methylcytosine-specific restriction endonuclease McrA
VADHLIPRAHGGPDALFNYAAAHRSCNARRGAKWPTELAPPRGEERDSNFIYDVDPRTGKMSSWPRHSRDW